MTTRLDEGFRVQTVAVPVPTSYLAHELVLNLLPITRPFSTDCLDLPG